MDWRMDVTGEMPSLRATNRQARDLLSPAPRRINLAFLLLSMGARFCFSSLIFCLTPRRTNGKVMNRPLSGGSACAAGIFEN
jgi:hypothetical protein